MPVVKDKDYHRALVESLAAAQAEIERLRYWLMKIDRDDIVNDADKFAGPEEERRRDAFIEKRLSLGLEPYPLEPKP